MMKYHLKRYHSTSSAFHQYSSTLFKPTYGAFIDGSEKGAGVEGTFQVFTPATNEPLCQVTAADKNLTDIAIRNCHETFKSGVWSRSDVRFRLS